MEPSAPPRYSFGPFLLDPAEKVLLREGHPVALPPKAIETLVALTERPGHIVEKAELLNRVWPDTFVEEATLAQNIFTLRKVLGESSDGHPYIETVPKRGYRFVCALGVAPHVEGATPSATGARPKRGPLSLLAAISLTTILAVTVAAGYVAWRHSRPRPAPAVPAKRLMIAVLPIANLNGDPQNDYFSEGLTEEIITQLGQMQPQGLGVIAKTSAMRYADNRKSVQEIARELGVDYILLGSVRREDLRVRISVQLIRGQDQSYVWAQNYDRDLRHILALESELAHDIAGKIQVGVAPLPAEQLGGRSTDPETYEAYLKGRYFWNKRTEVGYMKAISYFQSAIEGSPGYARAYAGLADAYALLGSMPNEETSRAEAMSKAKADAINALQLDDSLAEAHTSLAFVKMHYDWDWKGAEQEFRRAIELNPNYATAHHWYAYDLAALNRMPEALNEIWRAQQIDPLSAIINTDVAEFLYYAGRYDQAIRQAKVALEIDPQFLLAHSVLGEIYSEQHRYSEAVAEGKRAVELSGRSPWMLSRLGRTYALSGDRSQAEQVLRQLVELSASHKEMSGVIAGVAAALGKHDEAFAAVQKACEERDGGLMLLNYDHVWDPLRSDPRFQQLVRRVGLPP